MTARLLPDRLGPVAAPLLIVDRPARGEVLAEAPGHVDGLPFVVSVTASEVHFGFTDRHGPRFAIDLNALAKAATDCIEREWFGRERP